jgi:PIN domain nuclease of toxin-antitoxin system
MRLLLDTHALLWALEDDPRLGARARAELAAPGHSIHVSVASALAAQSLTEGLTIVSADPAFDAYGVVRVW